MKEYLLHTFQYNDWANRKLLQTILQLPEKEEAIRLFSHLITAQDKWMNRIAPKVDDAALGWFEPAFAQETLEIKWRESFERWLVFLESKTDEDLNEAVTFLRASDGRKMSVKISDVALQLNYHAIHHRAQINKLISAQGVPVPTTDYIFTALTEFRTFECSRHTSGNSKNIRSMFLKSIKNKVMALSCLGRIL